ncbi:MAG: acyltransferase [Ferruginibacter sp.]
MSEYAFKVSYFKNLDAFRFFSFLSVFFGHTLMLGTPSNLVIGFLRTFITMPFLVVPFFFTLSSFLITYRLLIEKGKNSRIDILKFYKNRILRIWPAYYLLIIICFVILPLTAYLINIPPPTLPSILPFLLFYANFYMIENGVAFTFALTILWSISIEEQFYLVWVWVLKLFSKKILPWLIILLFICSIAFSYYYLIELHKSANNLVIHSFYVLQNFCTGALMAVICFQKQKVFKFLNKLHPATLFSVYLILPVAYFFIQDIVLLNIIKSLCYSFIIYDQCFNERRFFNAGKFAFLNYLGKISYGLYLYHALVFVILQKQFDFFKNQPTTWTNLFQVLTCFIFTFIVAHLSYRYIESKFLALKSTRHSLP